MVLLFRNVKLHCITGVAHDPLARSRLVRMNCASARVADVSRCLEGAVWSAGGQKPRGKRGARGCSEGSLDASMEGVRVLGLSGANAGKEVRAARDAAPDGAGSEADASCRDAVLPVRSGTGLSAGSAAFVCALHGERGFRWMPGCSFHAVVSRIKADTRPFASGRGFYAYRLSLPRARGGAFSLSRLCGCVAYVVVCS
jgi:hypothetical protein